ncbi:hypothetical protein AWQ21_05540 [Picosynechococcus sp. PCC 7003]|nr:hypothetical protein AWQ21_05540 [Picosynechococcus sp. PCC 7003]
MFSLVSVCNDFRGKPEETLLFYPKQTKNRSPEESTRTKQVEKNFSGLLCWDLYILGDPLLYFL